MATHVILEAGGAVLRPYRHDDEGALVQILGDPEVMRFAVTERALAPDEARRFVQQHLTGNETYRFQTICLANSGDVAGFGGYRGCQYLGCEDVEFGWVIARSHHGHGYATALGEQMISHGLGTLGLWRILGACHPLNAASAHVLRDKLGMRFRREVEPAPGFRRCVFTLERRRPALQAATLQDLETAASWITSSEECARWTGPFVRFPFDAGALAASLGFHERQSFRVGDARGQLVAFGQFDMRAERRGHLARLIVKPLLRGQGAGETLVEGLLAHARREGCARASLNVEDGNEVAIALYERLGFADAARPGDELECPGARYMECDASRS